jgi:hypothetical protein
MKWNFQIVKAQHYREIGNIPGVEYVRNNYRKNGWR